MSDPKQPDRAFILRGTIEEIQITCDAKDKDWALQQVKPEDGWVIARSGPTVKTTENSLYPKVDMDRFRVVARRGVDPVLTPSQATLRSAMEEVEEAHFRSVGDTGNHQNALVIWNALRTRLGFPALTGADLPRWDSERKAYVRPHDSKLLWKQHEQPAT